MPQGAARKQKATHMLSHYGVSQDIEYSPLCYTVGSCCLPESESVSCSVMSDFLQPQAM